MAVTTTPSYTQNLRKKFSYKAAQEMMSYLGTFNCESQTVAKHSSNVDIKSTGTKAAFINGQPVTLEVDAAMDISADTTETTLTAWATATAYTAGNIRQATDGSRMRCILAHTSSADDEPHKGYNWETYWEDAPHGATNAAGATVGASTSRWFMVTAQHDGTLNVWTAGDAAADGSEVCKVPQYDAKLYCPVAFMHVNAAAAFTMGTTTQSSSNVVTYLQVTGPVFPHEDNWDAN